MLALKQEPANNNNSLLISNLATVQRYQRKYGEALKNYDVALAMTPKAVTLLKNRASLYLELDSLSRAYMDYEKVILLDVDDIDIKFTRNKTDNLLTKTQGLQNQLEAGIHPRIAIENCGLYSDPQQVYMESAEYLEKWKVQGEQDKAAVQNTAASGNAQDEFNEIFTRLTGGASDGQSA